MFHLASPVYLLLLAVIPYLWWRRRKQRGALGPLLYSDVRRITRALGVPDGELRRTPPRHRLRGMLHWMRTISLVLVILSLSRPQAELVSEEIITHGVDILLLVDISGSMQLIDKQFGGEQDRLEITKTVVSDFVAGREHDRIGLVVYAGEAYTRSPLTVDYSILTTFLQETNIGDVPETGTAIGLAIATGLSRLRHTEAQSKVMILLTDGRNNRGEISPRDAAKMASALGIKVYTIGVGGHEEIYQRLNTIFGPELRRVRGEELDEEMLKEIAQSTGGQYYRALDRAGLQDIFDKIGELEKSEIETKGHRRFKELFPYFLLPGLLIFLAEILLSNTKLRKLP